MTDRQTSLRQGYIVGIVCYLLWGVLPVYFKAVSAAMPLEVVAHRVVWSVLLLFLILVLRGRLTVLARLLRDWRVLAALSGSAVLIAINWLIYIHAVTSGHILAASLGYFLNPLVSVGLGVGLLKETLRPAQKLAILAAAIGVSLLAFSALDTLWISVTLAVSFAFYGLIRKVAPVDALPGLMIETLLLLPFAGGYLVYLAAHGMASFGQQFGLSMLLASSGVITSVPLLLFTMAARRLPLATMGLLQYIAPSLQFLVGLLVYGELLGIVKLASFAVIWAGLAIFTWDAVRGSPKAVPLT